MKTIGGVSRAELLEVAEKVLSRFISLPQNPNPAANKGCYICIMEGVMQKKRGPKIVLIVELGKLGAGATFGPFELCQEKVKRLENYSLGSGHISSWQSRDGVGKYGGAIIAPKDSCGNDKGDLIGGVSGLIEKGDEAVILVIWMVFRWIMLGEARRIAAISNNEIFEPLLKACNDLL
jgi:hypothetical protein